MLKRLVVLASVLTLSVACAVCQTTVTTSGGTSGTIPVFTSNSDEENSIITQSNGSIGIGIGPFSSSILAMQPTFTGASGTPYQGINVLAYANPTSTSSKIFWGGLITSGTLSGNAQTFTEGFIGNSGQAYHRGTGVVYAGIGSDGEVYNLSTGTLSWASGGQGYVSNSSSGTISSADGYYVQLANVGSGTISSGYGLYVGAPINSGGGQFGSYYGLYIAPSTVGSPAYGVYSAGGTNYFGGNVGIGTTTPGAALEVNGNVKLTASSGASITFADGTTQSTAYTGVSCGGDFAESVDVTGNRRGYEPGDILVIDPKSPGKFLEAAQPYSTLVAGIYSTRPGYVGRRLTGPKSADEVPMAMVGIVPTKVTTENGPIHTGDLLVASSTAGRAMKGTDPTRLTGAVIGKALGSLNSGTGTIEVLVTLQ